jgi:hypothetical protein
MAMRAISFPVVIKMLHYKINSIFFSNNRSNAPNAHFFSKISLNHLPSLHFNHFSTHISRFSPSINAFQYPRPPSQHSQRNALLNHMLHFLLKPPSPELLLYLRLPTWYQLLLLYSMFQKWLWNGWNEGWLE